MRREGAVVEAGAGAGADGADASVGWRACGVREEARVRREANRIRRAPLARFETTSSLRSRSELNDLRTVKKKLCNYERFYLN